MGKVAILGAGVMGSAMAVPAAAMGHEIALIGTPLDDEIVRSVAEGGPHPRLGLHMPEAVTAWASDRFDEAVGTGADLLILGVSSLGVPWAVDLLAEKLKSAIPVVMLTKGVAVLDGGFEVMPRALAAALHARTGLRIPVMGVAGPCIAGELAAGRQTSVVITGDNMAEVARVIAMLAAPFYHARPSGDVVGVELCAAFKNFYAIGVGWAAGFLEREGRGANGALAHNLGASLFAQAAAELRLLVERLGGERSSVEGLPGIGDLYVTCQAGRNSRLGRLLGLGLTYAEAKSRHMPGDTVEGADLALAAGPILEAMWSDGRLPGQSMPLSRALLAAICQNRPMAMAWNEFHH